MEYWQKDSRELRQDLKFPLRKKLVYYEFDHVNTSYKKHKIINYKTIIQESINFSPVQHPTLHILLETGEEINILAMYLAQMQKRNFLKKCATYYKPTDAA